jgi:hypothetical protein
MNSRYPIANSRLNSGRYDARKRTTREKRRILGSIPRNALAYFQASCLSDEAYFLGEPSKTAWRSRKRRPSDPARHSIGYWPSAIGYSFELQARISDIRLEEYPLLGGTHFSAEDLREMARTGVAHIEPYLDYTLVCLSEQTPSLLHS